MSDAANGVLVLVVGPSGAGKDTVIDAGRAAFRNNDHFHFARRLITRSATPGTEDHDTCSLAEFDDAVSRGELALEWAAHGLRYGIRNMSLAGLAREQIIVASISRKVVPVAEGLAGRVILVEITAPVAVLAQRLSARGRESEFDIAARLAREVPLRVRRAEHVVICNDRSAEEAQAEFIALLHRAKSR
jgi:ribose 1,5-bisphosphokinase